MLQGSFLGKSLLQNLVRDLLGNFPPNLLRSLLQNPDTLRNLLCNLLSGICSNLQNLLLLRNLLLDFDLLCRKTSKLRCWGTIMIHKNNCTNQICNSYKL